MTKPTSETPFFLVYGVEAVLRIELKHGSPWVLAFNEEHQDDLWEPDMLLLDEARRQATLHSARYENVLHQYHRRNIRPHIMQFGDLFLRRILSRQGFHKVLPMWEGPFRVVHVSRPDATWLEIKEGVPVHNTWTIQHLYNLYL